MLIYGTNSNSSSRRSRNGTITPNLCLGFIESIFVGLVIAVVSLGFIVVDILVVICTRKVVRSFDSVKLRIYNIKADQVFIATKEYTSVDILG